MDSAGETFSVFNMMMMHASVATADATASGPAGSATGTHASIALPAIAASSDSDTRRERKEIITGDSLLRIMTDSAAQSHNEVNAFAERGNLARIS